jgi:hypothetical protein
MPVFLTPFSFFITSIAGWLNQYQQDSPHWGDLEPRPHRESGLDEMAV